MKYLVDQNTFEELWFNKPTDPIPNHVRKSDRAWIIYFTASWCGPCRRVDKTELELASERTGVPLWICDIDSNDYTSGYCGVRSIPYFMFMKPKTIVSEFQSSSTHEIVNWMEANARK